MPSGRASRAPRLPGEAVADAYALAATLHRSQTDKLGAPYVHHVLRVAAAVRDEGPAYEVTAALHDAVEDTPLTLAAVRERFGDEVADAVDAMTKRPGEDYAASYLPRVAANRIARVVKAADSADNLGRIGLLTDPAVRARLRARYEAVLDALGVGP